MAKRTAPPVDGAEKMGNDARKQSEGAAMSTVNLITPADWDAFDNVTDDGLLVMTTDTGGMVVVTADDPDGTGYVYRTWFIPTTVTELPSTEVREVLVGSDLPVDMQGALRVVIEAYDTLSAYAPEGE